jgi:CubicO group peptidase (beta-lactamase class C family)
MASKSTRIHRITLIYLIFSLILPLNAAPPVIPNNVKSVIRQRVDYGYSPSLIVGMVNGDGRTYYSYGTTTLESERLPDEHTFYEIGSITKIFTTTLLAEMVERGEVSLDDPVQQYLPDTVNMPTFRGVEITLEDLATHVSGLPDNPESISQNNPITPFSPYPIEQLYEDLNQLRLRRTPGSTFEYSNFGLGLLGHALALSQGTDYETLLRERILTPLELNNTMIHQNAEQDKRRAKGYGGVVERPYFEMDALESAGVLLSTAEDLLTFAEHIMGLKTSNLAPAFTTALRPRVRNGLPGVDIGLGWFIVSNTPDPIIMHDGATMGHTAFLGMDPENQTAAVILTNARLNRFTSIQDMGLHLLFPPATLTTIRKPTTPSTEWLQSIYGSYANAANTTFRFRFDRDHLIAAFPGNPDTWYTLYASTSRRFEFYEATTEASATFNVNQAGNPISMTWNQSGQNSQYPRVPVPAAPLEWIRDQENWALKISDGDGATSYEIESTKDFETWTTLEKRTLWDEPLSVDLQRDQSFFRAVATKE